MTLNITHVRGKGGYNGGMTLKLSRYFRVRSLHMCAKFRGSTTYSCRENPDWGGGFDLVPLEFSSKFHLSYKVFKFLVFNQHVLNRVSLPADDWGQQRQSTHGSPPLKHRHGHRDRCSGSNRDSSLEG